MRYVIFWPPGSGNILGEDVTQNIIEAAKRGKITQMGENVLLVPDRRYGKTVAGLQMFGSVKRRDCIRLVDLVPRFAKKRKKR